VASCLVKNVAEEFRVVIEKILEEDGVTVGLVQEEAVVGVLEDGVVGEKEEEDVLVEEIVSSTGGGGRGGGGWGMKR